jgi:hypothetical protein
MEVKSQKKPVTVEAVFFRRRVVNICNKLSSNVVEASSINSFKKQLDDWSMDVEL